MRFSMREFFNRVKKLACLLEYQRVRNIVNVQDLNGDTALHLACRRGDRGDLAATTFVFHFLQAGADLTITNKEGLTPLTIIRQHNASEQAIIALLEQALDAKKIPFLVKARRLAISSTSGPSSLSSHLQQHVTQLFGKACRFVKPCCVAVSDATVAPSSFPQNRIAQGQPLPRVTLAAVTDGQDSKEDGENRKLLAFICGIGREGMPLDVFRAVINLLVPTWDPLRRKNALAGR